jgi:hypothetical protein
MDPKTLTMLDKTLESTEHVAEILIQKRGLYLYVNHPNKKSKDLIIHKHTCGHCAWGSGKQGEKEPGKNGVWMGPFSTDEQVKEYVGTFMHEYLERVRQCSDCF